MTTSHSHAGRLPEVDRDDVSMSTGRRIDPFGVDSAGIAGRRSKAIYDLGINR
jgi:hypothetical protein